MPKLFLLVFTFLLYALPIRAVIVAGGDGTQNSSAPVDDPGWTNVGSLNGASGVYLGSYGNGYWVLTASHVGIGDITFGSTIYNAVGGSGVQVSGDLYAFRISTDPLLPNLTLASTTPPIGSSVVMIGNGLNRATNLTTWYVDTTTNPYTWNTSNFVGASIAQGYFSSTGNSKRWGTNTIDAATTYDIGTGVTTAFTVDFDSVAGEAMGASGDSGGAVFYKNGSLWELAGLMGAINTFSGQPANTAVFGDITNVIDLGSYASQLDAITQIPEPAMTTLGLGLGVLGLAFWRGRKSRRG